MHVSFTVMEIWHLKDNGVTTLTFWSHVTSSVTWPFDSRWATFYGWSILHCYGDIANADWQTRTDARTDARTFRWFLYSLQCYALHWTDKRLITNGKYNTNTTLLTLKIPLRFHQYINTDLSVYVQKMFVLHGMRKWHTVKNSSRSLNLWGVYTI